MTRFTVDFCSCFTKATKIILKETGLEDVNWIHLALGRENKRTALDIVVNLRVPCDVRNFLNIMKFSAPFGCSYS
jgi:hypothetical protein